MKNFVFTILAILMIYGATTASAEEMTQGKKRASALKQFKVRLMFEKLCGDHREVRTDPWTGKRIYEIFVKEHKIVYEITDNGEATLFVSVMNGDNSYTLIDQGFDGVVDFGAEGERGFVYQKEDGLSVVGREHFQKWQNLYDELLRTALMKC